MKKDVSLWARTIGSLGLGLVSCLLIGKPVYEVIRENHLPRERIVQKYLNALEDQKRIEAALDEAQEERVEIREIPKVEEIIKEYSDRTEVILGLSSNYTKINEEIYSRIALLDSTRSSEDLYIWNLRCNPKVEEWANRREKNIKNGLLSIPAGIFGLFCSYSLFPRRKEEKSKA